MRYGNVATSFEYVDFVNSDIISRKCVVGCLTGCWSSERNICILSRYLSKPDIMQGHQSWTVVDSFKESVEGGLGTYWSIYQRLLGSRNERLIAFLSAYLPINSEYAYFTKMALSITDERA